MSSFSFELATRIEFGQGYINNAGIEAKKLGMTKAMVIADKGVIGAGLVKPIEDSLKKEGIDYVIYDQIVPNPRDFHCVQGAEFGKEHKIDGMIAIGGGSSIDTAKAIGTLITNGGVIRDWCGNDLLKEDIPPLIAVPTTAGTGSEVTNDSVITDTTTHEKLNIMDMRIAPKVALLDPDTLMGLPKKVMAACGVDAFIHSLEAYTCKLACPHTDAFAVYGMEMVARNLRDAVFNPTLESCSGMMIGSNMGGLSFGYSDVAAVHCIAEALGGRYDIPHGVANSIVLPTVIEYNVPAAISKYANVARILGVDTSGMSEEDAAYSCVGALAQLCADVEIPKMKEIEQIDPADFRELAEASFRNVSTPDNPREVTADDYFDLLTKAYNA